MSAYPSDRRCPRCQYPVPPGAAACANCGLALTGAQGAAPGSNPAYPPPPGSHPAYPPPPGSPSSGGSYSTLPSADPYGSPGSPGGAGNYGSQQPTVYGGSGTMNSAPTIQSPLYPPPPAYPGSQPPQQGYPPPPTYPGSQPQGGFGSAPVYPGSQPQSGFSLPPTFPGSQPQSGFGPPPTLPGSQPPGGLPGGISAPPVMPQMQPTQQKGNGLKIALIALVILIVLVGGGTAAYLLTRPKPVITITSNYNAGSSTPAGAADTAFHVTGQKFSGSSSITFLLDGQQAPGTQAVQSDSNGNVTTDLKVTKEWPLGAHTITAKDAAGYVTQAGSPIQVVCQGCNKTPGPHGSPTNSASFSLKITITSRALGTVTETLIITGKDDTGGTVCQSRDDSQTTLREPGTLTFADGNKFEYVEVSTNQCSGAFVGGHLTYIETTVTDEFDFNGGPKCPISPHKKQALTGDFTDANTISGTFSEDSFTLTTCQETADSGPITVDADSGTFTGTLN